MELSQLKGIGQNRLKALHAAGICSLRDLLFTPPVRYRDMSRPVTVAEAPVGQRACMALVREGEAKISRHGRLSRVTCTFTDNTGRITAVWFNQPWMKDNLNSRTRATLFGQVEAQGRGKKLMNPSLETELRIIPVYRPIEGLPQKIHEAIVKQALEEETIPETLPRSIRERYRLWGASEALRALHQPASMEEVAQGQRRFAFEQMLLYQAAVRMVKDIRGPGPVMDFDPAGTEAFWQKMPFRPTTAQKRTLEEIAADMIKPCTMARMVQGDVGSGKTAVAMGAMLLSAQSGYQSALMAPTEILARQHYEGMKEFFEKQGYPCGLLLGGMPAKERRQALHCIADGTWKIIIGTHALIGKGVAYQHLGLCVTDEQHRFGVAQRTALIRKGEEGGHGPHLLVMSATPIPRSLALVLFGDLDLSVMDELPPGRLPVSTRIVPDGKREGLYGFVRQELEKGHQAYFVCPLVEESENADCLKAAREHAQELQTGPFRGYRVGLTYGSQPPAEKEETLHAFAAGQTDVLVSTTVIEVGVNVPNATLMVIEDADRYGLAQLHQLRGRVGRGSARSWCFLLAQPNERLRALAATNDGFEVARIDLEQRGPGELLGTRQHGETMIPGGTATFSSMKLLYAAAQCAEELQTDPACSADWQMVKAEAEKLARSMGEKVSIS